MTVTFPPRLWNAGLVSSGASLTSWGEGASLALVGHPSSDGITIKMPYASAAASEFFERVQVGIDVYIPHRKYQVKPHSSPWFSAACAAAIVHINHFFRLYQRGKSSNSKVKFR